jgi:hypothetical protein
MNNNSGSSINMTSAMVELARIHLRDADKALTTGNTTGAVEQLSLARLQISMMGMKTMATMNETQAMDFMKGGGGGATMAVPDNCILLKGGVLECRDPLTQSISFSK